MKTGKQEGKAGKVLDRINRIGERRQGKEFTLFV
jgi:hypothetical protein